MAQDKTAGSAPPWVHARTAALRAGGRGPGSLASAHASTLFCAHTFNSAFACYTRYVINILVLRIRCVFDIRLRLTVVNDRLSAV